MEIKVKVGKLKEVGRVDVDNTLTISYEPDTDSIVVNKMSNLKFNIKMIKVHKVEGDAVIGHVVIACDKLPAFRIAVQPERSDQSKLFGTVYGKDPLFNYPQLNEFFKSKEEHIKDVLSFVFDKKACEVEFDKVIDGLTAKNNIIESGNFTFELNLDYNSRLEDLLEQEKTKELSESQISFKNDLIAQKEGSAKFVYVKYKERTLGYFVKNDVFTRFQTI